jgi:UDP-N-acetylmuramate--alanine ligase
MTPPSVTAPTNPEALAPATSKGGASPARKPAHSAMPARKPMSRPTNAPGPQPVQSGAAWPGASCNVYMIGIGGCGMSGLARLLKTRGATVSGTDQAPQESTKALEAEGINVGFEQSLPWLPDGCGLVVISAAVKPDHPQVAEARRRGVPVLTYAEALGRCMLGRTGIAVAGTHGKSSTTAMLGTVLVDCGIDPSVIVGATSRQLAKGNIGSTSVLAGHPATGFRLGSSTIVGGDWRGLPGVLVAEACEFNRSFHNFRPTLASISSVEADHLDCYKDLGEIIESFRHFVSLLPAEKDGGRLLIAHDGAHRREVTAGATCRVETIGFSPQADWSLAYDPATRRASLSQDRKLIAQWTMRVPGAHMAFNAGVALTLATFVGADPRVAAASLCEFRGIDRRMQFLGEKQVSGGTVRVYDDYGHHPTEVDVTLRALRDFERPEDRKGRLICVFQPHQHSRTRHLLDEFVKSFDTADVVIVPEIYFVRDKAEERHLVTAADLVDRLRERGVKAMHVHPFGAIVETLADLCRANDLVVTMGAGPVYKVAEEYLAAGSPKGGARP